MSDRTKPKDTRKELGNFGEELAAGFLEALGYDIVERNFRLRTGEIDLIVRDGRCLVFCEVRTMRKVQGIRPEDTITPTKQRRISRTANAYLSLRKVSPSHCRFDVISIDTGTKSPHITHIKDAFEPIL